MTRSQETNAAAAKIKQQACAVLGYDTFAELTLCVIVKQLVRKGRTDEAADLLRSFCQKYQLTERGREVMRQQNLFA